MKVFISHSSADHDFVYSLAERLKKDNIDVWLDDWEIKVGDSIVKKIEEGLAKSSFFIIVFSRKSIESEWVKKELNVALMRSLNKKDIKILPVLLDLDPDDLPPLFSDIYSAKFSSTHIDENEYKKLIEPIFDKLKARELIHFEDIFFDNIEHLDLILDRDKPTKQEIEFVMSLINDKRYKNYFLKKVERILWFNILKTKGVFDPSEELKPRQIDERRYIIPYWSALEYLYKISKKREFQDNEEYITNLYRIIENVTKYHIEKQLDNYKIWYYFIKILCNIPNEYIPHDIIDLIPIWLDSKFDTTLPGSEITTRLLPKFLTDNSEDIKKAEKIISYITELKNENKLVIDPYWIEEAFKEYGKLIGEKCSIQVIRDITKKIRRLLKNEWIGTLRSLYEESEYPKVDPLDLFTFILKRLLLSKAKHNTEETKEILMEYFREEHPYFKKMALFIIAENIDIYEYIFWEVMDSEIGEILIEKSSLWGEELRNVLQNLRNLSQNQITLLDEKIKAGAKKAAISIKETVNDLSDYDLDHYEALHKQRIYKALEHDPYFKALYEEMKKVTKIDVELKPAIKIETKVGFGGSPLKKEEIINMSNEDLAKFLADFKTIDFWEGPSVEGLAEVLSEVAQEMPDKFTTNMAPFLNTGYLYVHKILEGFIKAWQNRKIINWSEIFKFMKQYINREEFWQNALKAGMYKTEEKHYWVIKSFADLIEEGSRDDNWAFPEECFEDAIETLFMILDKLKIEKDVEAHDYIAFTLNSSHGRTLEALVHLSLRIARALNRKGEIRDTKWDNRLKEKFENFLKKYIIQSYTILGWYLPQFYYLDNEWTKQKIKEIEKMTNTVYWRAFMEGYLSQSHIYNEIYKLMHNHYKSAIDDELSKMANQFLVYQICNAYLRGIDTISNHDSLFKYLLEKFKYDHIKEIIHFFWLQREYILEEDNKISEAREKILNFLEFLYSEYNQILNSDYSKEDRQILSHASKLAIYLPQIDEKSYKWLLLFAKYVGEDFNTSFFIECLDKLKDKGDSSKNAEYIGKIFLEILKNYTPTYKEENIKSIVEFLYKSGSKDLARQICNIYGERGYEFLREIYKKYKTKDI